MIAGTFSTKTLHALIRADLALLAKLVEEHTERVEEALRLIENGERARDIALHDHQAPEMRITPDDSPMVSER